MVIYVYFIGLIYFLCVEISAVQVKPLSCSTEDLGAFIDPPFIMSTPIKRPRMENSADEIKDTSSGTIKDSIPHTSLISLKRTAKRKSILVFCCVCDLI